MNLAVIILNWNAANDTIDCIQRIDNWKYLKPTIIIVDNASIDNSVDIIRQACPNIRLICNEKNLGFAGGTNQGVVAALSQGDMPILLLNNDALIDESDLIRLLETLQENRALGFVGPLLFDGEHHDKLLSAGGKNPIKHHQTRILKLAPMSKPVQVVEYVSGTAVVIKAEVFRTVGYLDEDYFFSTELADLCMRAKRAGYLSAIDARARAFHATSRSASLRDTLYVYYIIRNRFIFIRNSPHKMKIYYYTFWAIYSLALALKLAITGQKATAQAVYMGLVDGLQGRFGGQNERVLSACAQLLNSTG